jgi:hypothetical protein
VATAQDIGRAGVAGAIAARIGQAEESAGDQREGHGTEQISGEDDQQGDQERRHRVSLQVVGGALG